MSSKKVWFITGTSKGFGLALVKLVLAQGGAVVATTRNIADLEHAVGRKSDNFLPLQIDLTNDEAVKEAIQQAVDKFGRLDIVVNNAGYSLVGSFEEMTDNEFRKSIDVNLFAVTNVIRHVMPYFRHQSYGHIINIASSAGYVGFANAGSYNIAKFAIIGLSEALAQEVAPLGVKVTMVAPGEFRTNFMDKGSMQYVANRIDAYGIDQIEKDWSAFSGQQSGDPQKLVHILTKVAEMENPPLRLLLGPDAYDSVMEQRKIENQEFEKWKHLTLSTNFE